MYELEAQLDKHEFEGWERETGSIWRDEMNDPQDWEEAYRNDPDKAYDLKQQLKGMI